MNFDPETTKAASEGLSLFAKMIGLLVSFIGGIMTATAIVVKKVSNYDARLEALEKAHLALTNNVEKKVDRVHDRLDRLIGKDHDDNEHTA